MTPNSSSHRWCPAASGAPSVTCFQKAAALTEAQQQLLRRYNRGKREPWPGDPGDMTVGRVVTIQISDAATQDGNRTALNLLHYAAERLGQAIVAAINLLEVDLGG